jgi:serine/threonine protein kinase
MTQLLSQRLETPLRDRYQIEREIGRGGMATVFLARDVKHERHVALKVLHPELAAVLGTDRFLREVRVTAQLQHPHILPLFDSGHAGDLVYYVMPYVQGESLRARLNREKQLPLEDAVWIAIQVGDALDYAHRQGVVHRDIKPENILFHEGAALVADFGIALAVDKAGTDRITGTGLALGTPEYMSPEQTTADRELDGRSDIYALGCVLYEMLAGEPPHTGNTVQSIVAKTLTDQPRHLRAIRPTVPPGVDAAVQRALQKIPADRFATAAEFSRALNALDVSGAAGATRTAEWQDRNHPVDKTFQLSMDVCRKLNRTTLDPRVIGDRLHYLDNEVESDTLIIYFHGLGLDQTSFDHTLRILPFRGLAPTMYGFEPGAKGAARLSIADHATLLREFTRDAMRRLDPELTILVGFSHGADLGYEVLTVPPDEPPLKVDGFLSLGCNVNTRTAFVSSVMAKLSADDTGKVVGDLRTMGADLQSLRDWMCLHDYLVRVFRKFQGDLGQLRDLAREIVAPFAGPNPPFPRWYQNAVTSVKCLRCVFSNSEADAEACQELKVQHMDQGILGPNYRDDTIVSEAEWNHFDLMEDVLHRRHLEEMLSVLRA